MLVLFFISFSLVFGYEWVEVTPSAEWSKRSSFYALNFKDSLTITQGYNVTSVWASKDGVEWTNLTSYTGISYRSCFPSVVYDDQILSMGGCNGADIRFNDVWSSQDGSNWDKLVDSAEWSTRCCFSAAVVNDSVFTMGGHDMKDYRNDVWKSTDGGYTWNMLTSSASWSVRDAYGLVVLNGRLYLMGGHDGSKDYTQWHNDVWQSTDGVTWTQVTEAAEWERRSAFGIVVWNGYIVVMGGWGNSGLFNDVWMSQDGQKWTQLIPDTNTIWQPRQWFATTVFEGEIYVLGGDFKVTSVANDVWKLVNDTK